MKGAVFLDRDGTLVDDPGFIARPEDVVLMAGAALAVRRLNQAGLPVIVVTNQSGLARGLITPEQFERVTREVSRLLEAEGATVAATYYCPHYPPLTGACECRKPGLLNYRLAAERFGFDLAASVYVGDRMSDLLPALSLGGRGILVRTGHGEETEAEAVAAGFESADDVDAAVSLILSDRA